MSILWVFVLLSCFLMTTNSSAIGEPKDVEKSPLPEVLDPNRGGQDQPMSEESQVLLQLKNASSAELNSSYCSQFDNSCVKCVKQINCTMVKYTKETKTDIDVEDIEFECFDITASLEEIRQSFADKTYNVIQTVSDCPTAYSKRPILKNGVKSNAGTTTQASPSSAKTTTQSTLMDNTTVTTDATNSTVCYQMHICIFTIYTQYALHNLYILPHKPWCAYCTLKCHNAAQCTMLLVKIA